MVCLLIRKMANVLTMAAIDKFIKKVSRISTTIFLVWKLVQAILNVLNEHTNNHTSDTR